MYERHDPVLGDEPEEIAPVEFLGEQGCGSSSRLVVQHRARAAEQQLGLAAQAVHRGEWLAESWRRSRRWDETYAARPPSTGRHSPVT